MTFPAEYGTFIRMDSHSHKSSNVFPNLADGCDRKRIVQSICTALLVGVAATVQGGTNVVGGAATETNRMYVIDVRTEGEWRAGHIKDAILIPYDQIGARISEVTTNKSASIAVYCRSGRRSGIALKSLQELGYVNVENLGSIQDARKKLGVSP